MLGATGQQAIKAEYRCFLLKWCSKIQNSTGQVTAFAYSRCEGAILVHKVELMASRDVLSLVLSKGLLVDFLECDALSVVKDITNGAFDSNEDVLDVLVEDVVYLLLLLEVAFATMFIV
ncbi:hypothetical protein TorRG33x02_028920 [Trema orientale]|uniref:RNase H type-1 domain-containing protein n=1 Tax=Trema orientale TaxID=63057 RepID=A0A2P5FTK6_TREOI|nr:hypothetical protein TorRG33x02_028920 [Trema orientale]